VAATSRTASTLSACSWPSFGATTLLAGGLATGYANMVPLTICRLTMAVVFGLGTGAVFKLIALEFPAQVGAVTGVVGATAACRLLPLPS
jgi:nitrate/nitrite transporter NarK